MNRFAVLMMSLYIAGAACAAERAPGTMRVVTCAAGQSALTFASTDADLVIAAARRGSVIVSRHRVLDLREVALAPAARPEDRRVATVARIALPGVPGGVYAVAVQLAAPGAPIAPGDALALADLVASLPGPVLVAGDLVPVAERPMSNVLPFARSPQRLFATPELLAGAVSALNGAAVADFAIHPPVPVLPMRRASI